MPTDDHDPQFERALARHLRDASPDPNCPDSETLAAYHERNLPLEEMTKWKEHIAACASCQEALVLVEQTEDVGGEAWKDQDVVAVLEQMPSLSRVPAAFPAAEALPAQKRLKGPPWSWVVPIGALAAGVIVWVGVVEVQQQRHAAANNPQMARNAPAPAAPGIAYDTQPNEKSPSASEQNMRQTIRKDESAPPPEVAAREESAATRQAPSPSTPTKPAQPEPKERDALNAPVSNEMAYPPSLGVSGGEVSADKKQAAGQAGAPGAAAPPMPAPSARQGRSFGAAKAELSRRKLASISGTVLDPSGAAISGATVTAIDTSSGASKTAVADAAGNFQLGELPADQYRVVVAQAGFAPQTQTLTLEPPQSPQLTFRLNVASSTETVEVTGSATALNTESAAVSSDAGASSAQRTLPANGRNYLSLLKIAASDPHYVVAPGLKVGWRLGSAGKLERSTDQGKTWKAQSSNIRADLTSGSAISDKVCWVVGKSGTILLTTDGGKHWKQVLSPISDDLGGIHAVNAQHAIIWDVPNRQSFETSDGGVTWTRVANE